MLFSDPLRDFDSLANELFGSARRASSTVPMDAWRDEDALHLTFDVPGVKQDQIGLEVDRGILTISVDRPVQEVAGQRLINERPVGRVARRITLGESLDIERIEARAENGILSLTIPMAERMKPRRIEIATEDAKELSSS